MQKIVETLKHIQQQNIIMPLLIKELSYASLHLEGCCNNYILILHIIMLKQKYHAVNFPYYKHIPVIDSFLHEIFNS